MIKQIMRAPGWQVFTGEILEDGAFSLQVLPVVGWALCEYNAPYKSEVCLIVFSKKVARGVKLQELRLPFEVVPPGDIFSSDQRSLLEAEVRHRYEDERALNAKP